MTRFRAVLFDMDGVLVDSEPHWNRVWREEVFPHAQRGTPTLDAVTGRNYRESLHELAEEYGFPEDVEHYARQFDDAAGEVYGERVTLTPGVADLFGTLREQGLRVAIVSSSPREWIRTVVERFDLPVDAVVSAMDIDGPGKPAPRVYEHAAERLDVDPAECVVVEDSAHGVRAGADAGATVVRFRRGGGAEAVEGSDAVAADPSALRETVLGLLEGT